MEGAKRPMKRMFLLAIIATLAFGCSTMTPARYTVSVDTRQTLKQYDGILVYLEALEPPESYEANCRLMGPIKAGDGLTIPEFITDAFNDEFKFAEIYDKKQGIKLFGKVNKIEFSSSKGLTHGWWDLYVTLNSPNGNTVSVGTHYSFESGFDAITACNQTAQALGMAVQDLVYNAVTHYKFGSLLK
jgi:hypothetical protein